MKKLAEKLTLILLMGAVSTAAWADEVDPGSITTFEAGTPAVAGEINGNFAALISAINESAQRIAALEEQIAALDPLSLPPVEDSSYTLMTFEALLVASNCIACEAHNVRGVGLSSGITILNFAADGTGTGSDVYDDDYLRSPSFDGQQTNALETEDVAFESDFTFTWSQDGNAITIVGDDPDHSIPFEMNLSYDGAVGVVRLVLRGSVGDPVFPVEDTLAGSAATQYGQVLGVAIRDVSGTGSP